MKVLLKGIGGVYNYGCEAIVRGTVKILRDLYSDIQIDYASYRIEDDTRRLKGCDVHIVPVNKTWTCKHVVRGILNKLHIKNNIFLEDYSDIKKYDAVFSIGGDIYTIYPGDGYAEYLVKYGEECYKRNVPYILWGCSVGPFEKSPRLLKIFKAHLSHIPLIVAREHVTINYLKSIGIENNVCFSYDPAFFVPTSPLQIQQSKKIERIGINLSPLSLLFLGLDKVKVLEIQRKTIERIISTFDCSVTLIPHVISDYVNDDDYRYLQELYNSFDDKKYKNKIKLVTDDPGFIGTKSEIKECDLVIAARMHCCINAITCGVPVIFLSYSEKSKGMCKLVYGSDKNCVPVDAFNQDSIVDIINNSDRHFLQEPFKIPNETKINLLNVLKRK